MKLNRVLGVLLGVKAGALLGMLFAQRSGKELREKLKGSENPLQTLFEEGWEIDKEIFSEVSDGIKNSESIQKIMEMGREEFEDFVDSAKDLTGKAKDTAVEQLKEIEQMAKDASKELEKSAKKVAKDVEKKATKVAKNLKKDARKFENKIDDVVETVKEKIKK